MKRFFCVSLAPALQRTVVVDGFRAGGVNRARKVVVSPGGKALNAAWVLRQLGCEASVAGLSGGLSGEALELALRERGVEPAFTRMPGETRCCISLVDGAAGVVSEVVEEAPRVADEVICRFYADVMFALGGGDYAGCCFCGTLPGWVPSRLYVPWVEHAQRHGLISVVDTWGEPLCEILKRKARPALLKLNREEASATWGDAWMEAAAAAGCPVLVTLGGEGALLFEAGKSLVFPVEPLRALNAVGCGDAATAGILAGLGRGMGLADSVRLAMACGRANAATLIPGDLGSFKG